MELKKPEGISAPITHLLPQYKLDAIRWMEKNYKAYLPGYIKGHGFGCVKKKLKKEIIQTVYDYPYGLQWTERIITNSPDTSEWKYQTYCTMGVACFTYMKMGFNDTNNILAIKYKDKDYRKHPISIFCQYSANEVCRQLEDGIINRHDYGVRFKPIANQELATARAFQGHLIIAAWENRSGPGHVSTVIGGQQKGSVYKPWIPMVYNIGAKNGYMTLKKAFGKAKDIRFYEVV